MLAQRRPEQWKLGLLLVVTLQSVGCATFGLGRKEDEYDQARRTINSYTDTEGNFIRPEGRLAEKQRNSNLPGPLKNLPLIGTRPINQELAKEQFSQGEKMFEEASALSGDERNEAFHKAAKKFDEAGKNWISSYLHQDALMMAGESYYFAEMYPTATERYAQLIKDYPRNKYQDHIDRRRMEISQFWLGFEDKFYHVNFSDKRKPWNDTPKHGVRILEKLRLDNPTGNLADDATMQIAANQFNQEKWPEALNSFDELISAYPDSKHLYQAHFLGIKAALLSYRGPDYSQEPLGYATRYFKNLRQFPDDVRKDKEEIDSMYTELVNRRAERLYHNALYRYNKGEAKAARLRCEEILLEHGETVYAEPAREMIAKLQGMPDEPKRYLTGLAALFPERDKTSALIKPLPDHVIEADKKEQMERTARALGTPLESEGLLYR